MLSKPKPMDLPVRAMSNLLMPVGMPHNAICRDKEKKVTGKSYLPCKVINKAKHGPIFEPHCPMPDHPHFWIRSERGVRRLQHEEMGKGKGVPPEWLKGDNKRPLRQSTVENATCLHLWTAAMDTLRSWKDEYDAPPIAPKKQQEEVPVEEWSTPRKMKPINGNGKLLI